MPCGEDIDPGQSDVAQDDGTGAGPQHLFGSQISQDSTGLVDAVDRVCQAREHRGELLEPEWGAGQDLGEALGIRDRTHAPRRRSSRVSRVRLRAQGKRFDDGVGFQPHHPLLVANVSSANGVVAREVWRELGDQSAAPIVQTDDPSLLGAHIDRTLQNLMGRGEKAQRHRD
jgi:hypothetical protein